MPFLDLEVKEHRGKGHEKSLGGKGHEKSLGGKGHEKSLGAMTFTRNVS